MTFRGDRDALLSRIDALERALADEQERAADERAALARERDDLLAELARLRSGSERSPAAEPSPPPSMSPPSVPAELRYAAVDEGRSCLGTLWAGIKWTGAFLLCGGFVVVVGIFYLIHWSVDAGLDRRARLVWPARVIAARGWTAPADGECAVRARVRTDGARDFVLDALRIVCAGETIYDWQMPHAPEPGDSPPSPRQRCDRLWREGHDGQFGRYGIRCLDVGGRTGGRPEMKLDTRARKARVFRDVPPAFRIDLAVEAASAPVAGKPLTSGHFAEPPAI